MDLPHGPLAITKQYIPDTPPQYQGASSLITVCSVREILPINANLSKQSLQLKPFLTSYQIPDAHTIYGA